MGQHDQFICYDYIITKIGCDIKTLSQNKHAISKHKKISRELSRDVLHGSWKLFLFSKWFERKCNFIYILRKIRYYLNQINKKYSTELCENYLHWILRKSGNKSGL